MLEAAISKGCNQEVIYYAEKKILNRLLTLARFKKVSSNSHCELFIRFRNQATRAEALYCSARAAIRTTLHSFWSIFWITSVGGPNSSPPIHASQVWIIQSWTPWVLTPTKKTWLAMTVKLSSSRSTTRWWERMWPSPRENFSPRNRTNKKTRDRTYRSRRPIRVGSYSPKILGSTRTSAVRRSTSTKSSRGRSHPFKSLKPIN